MWETLGSFVGASTAVCVGIWMCKLFLQNAMKILSQRIDHFQNQEIKHLEARLQLHSITLMNSLQIASRIGKTPSNKTIDAVGKIWKDVMHLERRFSPLVAVATILTEGELQSATRNLAGANETIKLVLEEFTTLEKLVQKLSPQEENIGGGTKLSFGMGLHRKEIDELRPFVSDKLWRIYGALEGVHGRFGFLMCMGIITGELKNWKNDQLMEKIVARILPSSAWEVITKQELAGFNTMTGMLEDRFILEARKNMRGTEELSETVAEVGQIADEEEAKARDRKNLYSHYNA